jgi:hypothetical protein
MKQIRPHVWFGALAILAVAVGLMYFNIRNTQSNIVRNVHVEAKAVQFERPAIVPTAKLMVRTDNDVAPETVAALAQFGLPATNLSKITVVAQSRPPVIIPNPIRKKQ